VNDQLPYYDENVEKTYRDNWTEPVFKKYLIIVRRHIWPAISVLLIVSTLGIIRAYRAVPIYQGVSKVLVERQGPRVTKFEDVLQPNASWWGQEYYKTQEELIGSRAVLDIALENPDILKLFERHEDIGPVKMTFKSRIRQTISAVLGTPPPIPPEPWERLRSAISARHGNNTHFINIKATSADPKRAAMIANAIAKAFVRYHMMHRLEINNEVFLYLEEQKEKEARALKVAEQKLQSFREETHIASLDSADKDNPILARLTVLNAELTDTQLKRIDVESQGRVIRQALGDEDKGLSAENEKLFSVPMLQKDTAISELQSALIMAESELAELSDVYGPQHPRMKTAMTKIASLRGKLRDALNNIAGSLGTQEDMLREKETALEEQYDQQDQIALNLAKNSLTFQRLKNEMERHGKLYEVLVERMREIELASDYTRTNVEIVEPASTPKFPIAPNKQRMAMFSIFFGLLLGIGLAFFLEHADDTVRTPDDLETRVGIPVLGFVPEITVRKNVESKTAYRAIVSALEPNSSVIEAYRNIRTSLFFAGPAEDSKVLMITAGGPGDGKTTTACNLALVIAQSGKRVLLIDADFRRPRVHKNFSLENDRGLSSVLVGECSMEEAAQKTVHDINIIENLDILPAGPTPPNPTELLESGSMRKLLETLRDQYDRIIIDTPPVLFVSDASILSTLVDGTILVVRANTHTRAHAIRARKQLNKVKARIVGGILNNVRVTRFGHHYSDFYYHGYARYRSDYYSAYYSASADTRDETKHNAEV